MGADRLLPFSNASNELYDSNPSASSSQDMSKFPIGPSHPGAGPRQPPHTTLAKKRKMSSVTNQSERRAQKIAQLPDEVQQMYEASDDEVDGSLSPDAESRNDYLVTKAVLAIGNSGPQALHDRSVRSTVLSTTAVSHPDKAPVVIDLTGTQIPTGLRGRHLEESPNLSIHHAACALKKAPSLSIQFFHAYGRTSQ